MTVSPMTPSARFSTPLSHPCDRPRQQWDRGARRGPMRWDNGFCYCNLRRVPMMAEVIPAQSNR